MTADELITLAKECGFSVAAEMPVDALDFREEVRSMCRADKCRSFDRSWSCPPACGTLEEIAGKARRYTRGVLVQTIVDQEDDFDIEAMMAGGQRHNLQFRALMEKLRAQKLDMLPMGMGACTICESCTYPDAPCRFPEEMAPSMEACGLVVSDVCKACDVPYYYGPLHTAYVSCVLF